MTPSTLPHRDARTLLQALFKFHKRTSLVSFDTPSSTIHSILFIAHQLPLYPTNRRASQPIPRINPSRVTQY